MQETHKNEYSILLNQIQLEREQKSEEIDRLKVQIQQSEVKEDENDEVKELKDKMLKLTKGYQIQIKDLQDKLSISNSTNNELLEKRE